MYKRQSYGHLVGDKALESISAAVQACLRESDILVRYGGDEFLLVNTLAEMQFSHRPALFHTCLLYTSRCV